MGDGLPLQGPLVVIVEVLQRLAGREPGGADPSLPAVGLPCRDLALQAGGQELLMRPGLGAGPLGQPGHCVAQGGGFQRPGQERDLAGHIPCGGGFGGHHATSCRSPGASSRSVTHLHPRGSFPPGTGTI